MEFPSYFKYVHLHHTETKDQSCFNKCEARCEKYLLGIDGVIVTTLPSTDETDLKNCYLLPINLFLIVCRSTHFGVITPSTGPIYDIHGLPHKWIIPVLGTDHSVFKLRVLYRQQNKTDFWCSQESILGPILFLIYVNALN